VRYNKYIYLTYTDEKGTFWNMKFCSLNKDLNTDVHQLYLLITQINNVCIILCKFICGIPDTDRESKTVLNHNIYLITEALDF